MSQPIPLTPKPILSRSSGFQKREPKRHHGNRMSIRVPSTDQRFDHGRAVLPETIHGTESESRVNPFWQLCAAVP